MTRQEIWIVRLQKVSSRSHQIRPLDEVITDGNEPDGKQKIKKACSYKRTQTPGVFFF